MSIIVNFIGGPGVGKSTAAAALFYELKKMGANCELVTEFPKDLIWEENMSGIKDQLFVFANQNHRQWLLLNKVDIIITDSPILLSMIYNSDKTSATFKTLVLEEFNKNYNINYFIARDNEFDQVGRIHNSSQAYDIDLEIWDLLLKYNIKFQVINRKHNMHIIAKEIVVLLYGL